MAFTKSFVQNFVNQLEAMGGDMFEPKQADLYKGDSVMVKFSINSRPATQTDLTGGIGQAAPMIAVIVATDWDEKVGRAPQKGDRLHNSDGKVYAIDGAHLSKPAGVSAWYKATLIG